LPCGILIVAASRRSSLARWTPFLHAYNLTVREFAAEDRPVQRLGLIGIAAFFFFAANASEAQQTSIESKLPKNWIGEFRWNGAAYAQRYDITLVKLKRLAPNQIEAAGCGRDTSPTVSTDISVRMVIDEKSLAVEILESNPSQPNFTTDGSHRGTLAKDLRSMETEWRTLSTGQRGNMRLRAGGDLTCPAD
jgi:hypothetical protein